MFSRLCFRPIIFLVESKMHAKSSNKFDVDYRPKISKLEQQLWELNYNQMRALSSYENYHFTISYTIIYSP